MAQFKKYEDVPRLCGMGLAKDYGALHAAIRSGEKDAKDAVKYLVEERNYDVSLEVEFRTNNHAYLDSKMRPVSVAIDVVEEMDEEYSWEMVQLLLALGAEVHTADIVLAIHRKFPLARIKVLLEKCADFSSNVAIFCVLSESRNKEVVRYLVKSGLLAINTVFRERTLLIDAISTREMKFAAFLLDLGADPNVRTDYHDCFKDVIEVADQFPKIFDRVLSLRHNVNWFIPVPRLYFIPIVYAVRHMQLHAVEKLMLHPKTVPWYRHKFTYNALDAAVANLNKPLDASAKIKALKIIRECVFGGCMVLKRGAYGCAFGWNGDVRFNFLEGAVMLNEPDLVMFFLQAGADPWKGFSTTNYDVIKNRPLFKEMIIPWRSSPPRLEDQCRIHVIKDLTQERRGKSYRQLVAETGVPPMIQRFLECHHYPNFYKDE